MENIEVTSPTMLASETLSLEQVALALGLSPNQLKRKARLMHTRFGFPRPISGSNWRWPAAVIRSYLRSGGALQPASVIPSNDNQGETKQSQADYVNACRNALHKRYGADQ